MSLELAKIIRNQIGVNTLMCIAAHSFMAIKESDKNLGGLTFKVGANPKLRGGGRVTVMLDFNDTYTVTICNSRGRILTESADVYAEDLSGPNGVIERVTG